MNAKISVMCYKSKILSNLPKVSKLYLTTDINSANELKNYKNMVENWISV